MSIASKLASAKRVLFMSHLALGDYLYQRSFLMQLCQHYPNITLDIWFDDFRVKNKAWSQGRTSIMSDWLDTEDFVENYYPIAATQDARLDLISKAALKEYDVVLILSSARTAQYCKAARKIAPGGYCVLLDMAKAASPYEWWHRRRMDEVIDAETTPLPPPILELYAQRFSQLAEFPAEPELSPLALPESATRMVREWLGSAKENAGCQHAVLVNGISTTSKRDYPWEKLGEVIRQLRQIWPDTLFVVNAPPHERDEVEDNCETLIKEGVPATVFTATGSVFELAAITAEVDAVVSVETAIMHFAAVTSAPLITLVRSQTAHWSPPSARACLKSDRYVSDISVQDVVTACRQQFFNTAC